MAAMNVSIVNELRVALDGIFSCVDSIPRKPLSTREKLDMLKRGEQGLRRCLQQVSETRSRVLSLRDDHSAIDKLPPELLLHIFEFAVFIDRSQHSWRRVPDLTWGPMELSFVCHRWRTLVLNTSSLWSTIVVHPGFPTDLFIERSKQHPVHFVYSKPSASLDSTSTRLNTHLTKRLRAVSCFAQTVRWFLAISGNFSFTSLQELELHSKSFVGSASPQRVVSAMPFPALKHVDLHNVCPSNIIRNTCTSPIRTARISFDSCIESGIRLNGLSMSRLHSFLTCTPELEQLTLGPGIPSMDVVLNRSTSGIGPLSLESTNLVSPVSLPQLHTLVWRAAPAKDLWRLFHIVDFPRLVTLDIALDSVEIRWPFVDGSLVVPMASYTTMSTYSLPPSISLNLKQLSLSCKDTLAASVALKKIAFPQLQDLTLIYNGVRYADTSSTLPAMKIFREPRMVNLTKLEVRNFSLDLEDTIIMLCHMQSLETLSLADCPGELFSEYTAGYYSHPLEQAPTASSASYQATDAATTPSRRLSNGFALVSRIFPLWAAHAHVSDVLRPWSVSANRSPKQRLRILAVASSP